MTNTNDGKWLIPSCLISKSLEKEKADWDEIHKDYSTNVFNLTQEPKISETLIRPSSQSPCFDIPNSPEIKVLIPGCGSEISLQKTLIEFCPQIGQIYCTDFSKTALDKAQSNWQQANGNERLNNQQLVFAEADSTKLTEQRPDWQDKFDYVLVVNSVLSNDDVKNRQMLKEFYKVLKPGGRLYGFFLTIFWDLEVAYLSQAKAHWLTDGTINLADSALYDRKWSDRQIFYTPLRLNRIFKEIGFKRLSFEVYLSDSPILVANMKETYDIDEPDIYPWEFLVRLEKQT
ncbi:class I SAM-dependent methyltransferase [Scytonema hofmannii FACHB-248]|uniref:Class I SAM-dependent methyltransferase n=1 Tax=Scytonema hofmannii FACHB-248 TaxID=1842502 RepID=A0ABR8GQ26_9CYAN|nr:MULTISPECIES: class I SAM-dependent methyltransferase [Nostocales]MBD2605294.1 class I SAM-dependent methyltransferase [Scytonema hofmannii FACHB-248]